MTTQEEFERVMAICRETFVKKMHDYGTAWRILRPTSLTDQIYIKANRIRTPIHDNFRVLPAQLDPECRYMFGKWPHGAWHESKITIRFWITTILLAALTIITLKIR